MPTVATLLAEAAEALKGGRIDEGAALARQILDSEPLNLEARRMLVIVHRSRGEIDAAAAILAAAVALKPDAAIFHLDLGQFFQSVGRLREAADSYHRAVLLTPGDGYARELYTQTLTEEWLFALTGRKVGREASKTYAAKLQSGFFHAYLSGANILDIGYRGNYGDAMPIVARAIGMDIGYPGYDGVHIPMPDESQDAVYSSHCLEHMPDLTAVIREWFRVLRIGGYLVVAVPHQHLYERKREPPSPWNRGHRHFFTPAGLLAAFEAALPPNRFRVRHLADNDLLYDYALPPASHAVGCYEIELVLQKIKPPNWELL